MRDRARISDVALLRKVAHRKVAAHQPADEIDLLGRQAQTLAGAARGNFAFDFLIADAFARVMQQHREIERASVDDLRENLRRERVIFLEAAFLDVGDKIDSAQCVLIHGEVVVHIELHLRDDAPELRQEAPEHARFVHQPQRRARMAIRRGDRQERFDRARILAHLRRDALEAPRRFAERNGMHIEIALIGDLEETQQIDRIVERFGALDVEAIALGAKARWIEANGAPRRIGAARDPFWRRLGLIGFELGAQSARELAHLFGDEKVALHEALNALLLAAFAVAQAHSHLRLQIERDALFRPARQVVKVAAHGPQELFRATERAHFLGCEDARIDILTRPRKAVAVAREPKQRV